MNDFVLQYISLKYFHRVTSFFYSSNIFFNDRCIIEYIHESRYSATDRINLFRIIRSRSSHAIVSLQLQYAPMICTHGVLTIFSDVHIAPVLGMYCRISKNLAVIFVHQ